MENLNVSIRFGWIFHLRQIRATEEKETPKRSAMILADECGIPSYAGGFPSLVRVSAISANSSITGSRPGRSESFSPSTPSRT